MGRAQHPERRCLAGGLREVGVNPVFQLGRMVEPFPEPRNLGKEWSGRAEILRSSLVVSEALVGGQRRCAGAT